MLTVIAWYAVAVGVLVVGLWAASLSAGRVPELQTKPWEIRAHLAAEALMAALVLAGGLLVLSGHAAGEPVLLVGLGATLYSVVASAGYYLERRQWPAVAMFAVLLVLTAVATAWLAGDLVAALP